MLCFTMQNYFNALKMAEIAFVITALYLDVCKLILIRVSSVAPHKS